MVKRDFLLGLGIGITIATILMMTYAPRNISKYQIERMAKDLGMKYEDDIKTYFKNDNK